MDPEHPDRRIVSNERSHGGGGGGREGFLDEHEVHARLDLDPLGDQLLDALRAGLIEDRIAPVRMRDSAQTSTDRGALGERFRVPAVSSPKPSRDFRSAEGLPGAHSNDLELLLDWHFEGSAARPLNISVIKRFSCWSRARVHSGLWLYCACFATP